MVHLGKFNLPNGMITTPRVGLHPPRQPSLQSLPAHSIQSSYIFFMCKSTSGDLMFIFTNTHNIPPPVSQVTLLFQDGRKLAYGGMQGIPMMATSPGRLSKISYVALRPYLFNISNHNETHFSHFSPLFSSTRASSRS